MASFVQLNQNNEVIFGVAVSNSDILDENGNESEEIGIKFLRSIFGEDTIWKQTSYNKRIRKNYAGTGYTYDESRDAFIPPKPYENWILNEETCLWEPPIPYPSNDNGYLWNEENQEWVLVE